MIKFSPITAILAGVAVGFAAVAGVNAASGHFAHQACIAGQTEFPEHAAAYCASILEN